MMTTLPRENLRVLTFDSFTANSAGEPVPGTRRTHNLLFNSTRISDEEVDDLIQKDMWRLDDRVLDIPTSVLNNLKDKKEDE